MSNMVSPVLSMQKKNSCKEPLVLLAATHWINTNRHQLEEASTEVSITQYEDASRTNLNFPLVTPKLVIELSPCRLRTDSLTLIFPVRIHSL